jgi:Cu+-exporting ATPase
MAVDPVCGMDVEPEKAAATSDYKGQTYYFCAEICKKKFDDDPEKYQAKGEPKKAGLWSRMFKS